MITNKPAGGNSFIHAVKYKLNLQERSGDSFNVTEHTNEIPGGQDGG
jgi:hypothetical protein